jgi:hypothetical protein
MESENLQQGSDQSGKSKIIIVRDDEKIEVEIREIIRVKPQDFKALKDSFEEWSNLWGN